jgi:hypothetical protein
MAGLSGVIDMKGKITFHWSPVKKKHEPSPASSAPGEREIAAWLSDDLQLGLRDVDAWTEQFDAIANRRRKGGYLGTGNAHSVMATAVNIYLRCEFADEQKVFLTHPQMARVLQQYREALTAGTKDISHPPSPFDFEYLAEGEEAALLYRQTEVVEN